MHPEFFLGIAHNVGDGFSYELLVVANHCDIPTYGRLDTVINSVIRKCKLSDTDAPTISEEDFLWVVTN